MIWLVLGLAAIVLLPSAGSASVHRVADTSSEGNLRLDPATSSSSRPETEGYSCLGLQTVFLSSNIAGEDSTPTLSGGDRGQSLHQTEARSTPLGPGRASRMVKSLTLPGWGQASYGHPTAGVVFGVMETGVWGAFAAFRIQAVMRTQAYVRTAQIFAGIDLSHRSDAFRHTVGSYLSSDDYNRLVVFQDAASLYPSDPMQYRRYIAEHELRGADTWHWSSVDAVLRYQGQRKSAKRTLVRANAALTGAVVNRIVSVIHASRMRPGRRGAHSWRLDFTPPGGAGDPTAFRLGIRRDF